MDEKNMKVSTTLPISEAFLADMGKVGIDVSGLLDAYKKLFDAGRITMESIAQLGALFVEHEPVKRPEAKLV